MADDRAYRIQISYNPDSESFTGRAPELDLEVSAASRPETIEQLEEAIDARMMAAAEGEPLPEPFDIQEIGEAIEIMLAPQLLRDLNYYAQRGGIDVESLAAQLLSYGIGKLAGRIQVIEEPTNATPPKNERGEPHRQGGRRRGRKESPRRNMDNQANFLEYVRDLEKGKGDGRRGR
jgi:hypothetical protein